MDFLEERKIRIIDNCPKCNGHNIKCSCFSQYQLDIQKYKAGIPPMFFDIDINTLQINPKQIVTLHNFMKEKTNLGLFIEGGYKTNNTKLMCWVLFNYLKMGKSVKYMDALKATQIAMSSWYEETTQEYDDLFNVDILAINDIGDERRPESRVVEETMDTIIRERLHNLKQIVFTSSMKIEEFTSIYTKNRYELIANNFKVLSFNDTLNINSLFADIRS